MACWPPTSAQASNLPHPATTTAAPVMPTVLAPSLSTSASLATPAAAVMEPSAHPAHPQTNTHPSFHPHTSVVQHTQCHTPTLLPARVQAGSTFLRHDKQLIVPLLCQPTADTAHQPSWRPRPNRAHGVLAALTPVGVAHAAGSAYRMMLADCTLSLISLCGSTVAPLRYSSFLTATSSPSTHWFSSLHQLPILLSQPMIDLSIYRTHGSNAVDSKRSACC